MCILYVCTCASWLVPQWLCTAVAFVSSVYISLCALNAAIYHVCIQVFDDKLVTQICTKGYMSPMCSTYTPFLLPPSLPSLSYTLQVYTFPLLHSGSLQHFPPLPSSPSHLPTLLYSSTIYCILCLGYIAPFKCSLHAQYNHISIFMSFIQRLKCGGWGCVGPTVWGISKNWSTKLRTVYSCVCREWQRGSMKQCSRHN